VLDIADELLDRFRSQQIRIHSPSGDQAWLKSGGIIPQ
jgi:hypothetical protein